MVAIHPETSFRGLLKRKAEPQLEPIPLQRAVNVVTLPPLDTPGVKKLRYDVVHEHVTYKHEIDPRRLDRTKLYQMLPWEQEYVRKQLDQTFEAWASVVTGAQIEGVAKTKFENGARASLIERTETVNEVGDPFIQSEFKHTDTVRTFHYFDAESKSVITFSRAVREHSHSNRSAVAYTIRVTAPGQESFTIVMSTKADMPGLVAHVKEIVSVDANEQSKLTARTGKEIPVTPSTFMHILDQLRPSTTTAAQKLAA